MKIKDILGKTGVSATNLSYVRIISAENGCEQTRMHKDDIIKRHPEVLEKGVKGLDWWSVPGVLIIRV